MDSPTFTVVGDDDVDEGTDLDLVLATDLRELLELIEGECRALRTKPSFRRRNADGGTSDSDGDDNNGRSMKPSTIAVGSMGGGGDDITIHDNTSARTMQEEAEASLSGDQLLGILDEIEDSCHKFRSESAEDSSSCSATVTCSSSSDDDSSSQGDNSSVSQWPDQRCDSSSSSSDDPGGDDNVGSLLAVACALRAGAEAWAVKGRHKSKGRQKKKCKNRSSHKTASPPMNLCAEQRVKLKGPRIRQCEPLDPMEI